MREARSGSTVAQVLVESGAISEEQLARATAERYGIAYIDLESYEVDSGAVGMIKPSAAKRYQAVPVGFVGGGLLGGDGRPGGRARRERHRRDDQARGSAGSGAAPGARGPARQAVGRGRAGRRWGRRQEVQQLRRPRPCSGRPTRPMAPDRRTIWVRSRARPSSAPSTPPRPSTCAPSWWSCAASSWARRPSWSRRAPN